MKIIQFEVQSIHPLEYRASFFGIFEKERSKRDLHFRRIIKEMAPPPDLVRDFVLVTASTASILTIIDILYRFYKEIKSKNKQAKVFITINGKTLDLEAHNIDELKLRISEANEQ